MNDLLMLAFTVGGLAVYFLPSIVAVMRTHHQAFAIILLNLFLGWTFIGWVVAIVWAATATPGRQPQAPPSV